MPQSQQPRFDEITASGAHRLDQLGAPKPYASNLEPRFREEIVTLLQSARSLQLTTVDEDGWPTVSDGACVAVAGQNNRPIVYYFAEPDAPEIRNIDREPRVTFLMFRASSFEKRRETRSVQMQAVATGVTDADEIAAARSAAAKRDDAAALRDLCVVRIEAAFAVYSNISARPQWGAIDYAPRQQLEAQRALAARGRFDAVVAEVRQLPGEVTAVRLAPPDEAEPFPVFPPGSHIQVLVQDDLVRPYSLSSLSAGKEGYQIGVLRERESRSGSAIICDQWRPGQAVQISAPRNFFPIDRTAQKFILIGGGVGITPLLSMAEHLAGRAADFQLHYCYKNEGRAAFKAALETAPFSDKVSLHPSEQRHFGFADDVGGVEAGTHLYVCGPRGFMDHVAAQARELGWADAQIHRELFGGAADTSGAPFSVMLTDGKTFEIPAGRTIAQVLSGEGYQIEMSCERGICGSCVASVLEGMPDHRDHFLTELEKMENGQIALCCSRARTPFLKLEL